MLQKIIFPDIATAPRFAFDTTGFYGAKQLAIAHTERDKSFYERKCSDIDIQIDNLMYELYELKDEEIALIESDRLA